MRFTHLAYQLIRNRYPFCSVCPIFPINSSLFHKIGAIKVVKNVTYPGTVDEERNVDL